MKKGGDMVHGSNEISTEAYLMENDQIIESVMEQTRREIERTDYLMSVNLMMSLGGGTGSGLGSRMVEELSGVFEEV